jgi:hypothetical protein
MAAVRSLEDLWDVWIHTPRTAALLVAASDPELGPYTVAIVVEQVEIEPRCRSDYRMITRREMEAMIGDPEDFAVDWKHFG